MTPGPVACQAPFSKGLTRPEYWNGLPLPSPRDLPDPGIKPESPALQTDSCNQGFPDSSIGTESTPQCGRPGFHSWVGKIPRRKERLPTLVFWPGEFHGLYMTMEFVTLWAQRVGHDRATFTFFTIWATRKSHNKLVYVSEVFS